MKTSFLTVTIAPAPFLFSLHTLCGHSWVVLISILIDVQYLQNDVFYFEKGLNGQMHSSSDAHHLIRKSTPSKISYSPSTRGLFPPPLNAIWKTLISGISRVFWHTVHYTASGYMLKADGHLIGKIPGRYRFLMF